MADFSLGRRPVNADNTDENELGSNSDAFLSMPVLPLEADPACWCHQGAKTGGRLVEDGKDSADLQISVNWKML